MEKAMASETIKPVLGAIFSLDCTCRSGYSPHWT